ncbi:MAG: glycosyltransferase family 2 protein [Candidatus Hydrogenedentota bacterium]
MYRDKKVALVIPAYNEEKLIRPTLLNVPTIIDHIYVINDGSIDKTEEVVKEMAKNDPRIELINQKKNMGVGEAIITGYKRVLNDGYDIAVVVGGDYQMPLNEVKNFLDPLIEKRADYTKGNRFLPGMGAFDRMPKIRLIGNMLITAMTKISSGYYNLLDVVDGYTAITRDTIKLINWDIAWKGYGYPMDFLIRLNTVGARILDIPRSAIYLEGERQSQIKGLRYAIKVSPMLLRGYFWRLFTKYGFYNFHPLLLFFICGLTFLPAGLIFGFYLVYKQFFIQIGVSGPQAVFCALLIITGLQFLLFGMLFDMHENKS